MALPDDSQKLNEDDLKRYEHEADDSVKALPEGPSKDALVEAFAAVKRLIWAYMTYNRTLLRNIRFTIYAVAALVAVCASAGFVVSVIQVKHDHRETLQRTEDVKRENLAAAKRAAQVIQSSRLASSYQACIQGDVKKRRAQREARAFVTKLSDGEIKSIKPVGQFFQRLVDDLTVSRVAVPNPLPPAWIQSCRAHAESVVDSPNTKFPPSVPKVTTATSLDTGA